MALLVAASVSVLAVGESRLKAGDHIVSWSSYGDERNDEEVMVQFEVYHTTPMPHWESDNSIATVFLEYVTSVLLIEPSYYVNLYLKLASGFVSGKTYRANYYKKVGNDWIYQHTGVQWTQE